jgi:chromate transporter
VILNLALWFAIHALFGQVREVPFAMGEFDIPVLSSLNIVAAALSAGAIIAVFRFKVGVLPVLGACAALGALYGLAQLA